MPRCFRKSFLSCLALPFALSLGFAGQAAAQSDGCSFTNAGGFDKNVPSGLSGTTTTETREFFAGETLTVTITNASNSLFEIAGFASVFNGQTGTQTASATFLVTATYTVFSDLQAGFSDAQLRATCSFSSTSGGGSGTDAANAVGGNLDAIDAARPSNAPGDLPSRVGATDILVILPQSGPTDDEQDSENEQFNIFVAELERDLLNLGNAISSLGLDFTDEEELDRLVERYARSLHLFSVATSSAGQVAGINESAREILDAEKADIATLLRNLGFLTSRSDDLVRQIERVVATRLSVGLTDSDDLYAVPARRGGNAQPSLTGFLQQSDASNFTVGTKGVRLGDTEVYLWTDAQIGAIRGDLSRDGYLASFRVGVVTAVSPTTDLGFYASYLNAETSHANPNSSLEVQGFGFGAYLKNDLGNNFAGGLSVFYERSDNDTTVSGATASFDRTYIEVNAALEKIMQINEWRVVPSFNIGVVHSDRDGYTDSAATTVAALSETYARTNFGLSVGRTLEGVGGPTVARVDLTGSARIGVNLEDRSDRTFSTGSPQHRRRPSRSDCSGT
ncbi:MAG: autotransporter outer membrane beta-barrel domain-containing protein, partial [Pseudomonadota bacterium]